MRLLFLLLVPIMLFSRENPFFPVNSQESMPLTTNKKEIIPPLKQAAMKLPSTARVIESVTVSYKNLDGSIATKKIDLHNSIDWHLPLFISQTYTIEKKQKSFQREKRYKKVVSLKFITFYISGKNLKIETTDKMLRNFLLVKPHRIVCDFKGDTDIGSFIKKLKEKSVFKKIHVGTHDGYYRVVVQLDGYYQYKITKIKGGYIFTLL